MGHQVIKAPNGTYAIFSSFTDTWIVWNATREDVVGYYIEKAVKDTRENVARLLDQVDTNPREAYYQFAMTFDEANAKSIEMGGSDLNDPANWEENSDDGPESQEAEQPDPG